jgi:hypothetical protein
MAGFDNDIVYAKNADFTQADNQAPSEANGLATNGQIWVGTTSVNAGGTHVNVGTITSPGGTITVGFSSPDITLDLAGGSATVTEFGLQTGTSPVVPDMSGLVTFNGSSVAAGTSPVRTNGTGANTMQLEVQRSQAVASTDATVVGLSAFDSASFDVDTNGFVTLDDPTVMFTLSDDVNTVVTPNAGNIQLVGHVVEQGATKFSTVVAGTNLLNINPMSPSRWIVDPLGFNGTHTTIASAIASATSGDDIVIMPATYTENITLKAGVNLSSISNSWSPTGTSTNVTIVGKVTASYAGLVNIKGIELRTNSDYCIELTGASATKLVFTNCFVNMANNSAINHTGSSGLSIIYFNYCQGISLGAFTFFTLTTAGSIYFNYSRFLDATNATNASTLAGTCGFFCYWSQFESGIAFSSTSGITIENSHLRARSTITPIANTSTSASNVIKNSIVQSAGTETAISIAASGSLSVIDSEITSNNTNAITGAGSVTYGGLTFTGTSSTINVTTQTPIALTARQGGTDQTSYTTGDILYSNATNSLAKLGIGSTSKLLTVAAGIPAWTTATYPSTAGSSGNVLTSDGTNWTSSAPSGGVILEASGTLTSAQIKSLRATPIQVIAAPGAGKTIIPISITTKINYGGSNVFVAGASQIIALYYGTSLLSISAVPNSMIVASSNQIKATITSGLGPALTTTIDNVAMNLYNTVATEISGNAANDNTIEYNIIYQIVTI